MLELWIDYATVDPRQLEVFRGFVVPSNRPHQKPKREETPGGVITAPKDTSWERIGDTGTETTGGRATFKEFFVANVPFLGNVITTIRFQSSYERPIPHVRRIIFRH
jgi:hypothetical protein